MPTPTNPLADRAPCRAGFVVALLVAWLGAMVSPCLMAAPAAPPPDHCDHGAPVDHAAPCADMLADGCAKVHDASSDGGKPSVPAPAALLLTLPLPTFNDHSPAPRPVIDGRRATGPPLAIRYCVLRN